VESSLTSSPAARVFPNLLAGRRRTRKRRICRSSGGGIRDRGGTRPRPQVARLGAGDQAALSARPRRPSPPPQVQTTLTPEWPQRRCASRPSHLRRRHSSRPSQRSRFLRKLCDDDGGRTAVIHLVLGRGGGSAMWGRDRRQRRGGMEEERGGGRF
jgi:hypothetical protein